MWTEQVFASTKMAAEEEEAREGSDGELGGLRHTVDF